MDVGLVKAYKFGSTFDTMKLRGLADELARGNVSDMEGVL